MTEKMPNREELEEHEENWVEMILPFWLMDLTEESEMPSDNKIMERLARRALEVTESSEAFLKIFPKDLITEKFLESWKMARSRRELAKKILAA